MSTQKLSLQQKMLQKLSPQQIQVIKLLEIPAVQLEQRIKKELEENPLLELGRDQESDEISATDSETDSGKEEEEFTFEDYIEDDIPDYRLAANNYSKDERTVDIPFSVGTSFRESMVEQLGLTDLNDTKKKIAEYVIGNIDEDGYLRRDLQSISDDLAFGANMIVTEEELDSILLVIQEFDPPGIGARDLKECLILQLKHKKETDATRLALRILEESFDEFAKKHYDKITRKYDISDDELREAIAEILKLNPKPGGSYNNPLSKSNQVIVPDFILENIDGELQLSLNQGNVPELKLNAAYLNMMKAYRRNAAYASRNQKDAMQFVKQKIEAAKWFIDALRQRRNTLLVTMTEIIEFQKDYFMDGDEAKLRPMILKDIADRTGLDISTISRVSNSKYIQTHFGILPLRYFFSEGMQKESGEEVSTREIKKILEDCIAGENKRKPLTDDKLARILKDRSYPIARRTVAKYREQLGIPVARLRKEL